MVLMVTTMEMMIESSKYISIPIFSTDVSFKAVFVKQYQDFVKATDGLAHTMSRFKKDLKGLVLFIRLVHHSCVVLEPS